MPPLAAIDYGDRDDCERTAPTIRNAVHAHELKLQQDGRRAGMAGYPDCFAHVGPADPAKTVEVASRTPSAAVYGIIEFWLLA